MFIFLSSAAMAESGRHSRKNRKSGERTALDSPGQPEGYLTGLMARSALYSAWVPMFSNPWAMAAT